MNQSPQTVPSRKKRHKERERSHIGWFVFCWKYTQSDFCSNAQGEQTFYICKEGGKVAEVKGGQGGHAQQWHSQEMSGSVRSSMCLWLRMLTDEAGETNWSQWSLLLPPFCSCSLCSTLFSSTSTFSDKWTGTWYDFHHRVWVLSQGRMHCGRDRDRGRLGCLTSCCS